MSYAINGRHFLGDAVPDWTGAPADDPRVARAYSKIRARYQVAGISGSTNTAKAVTTLRALAQAAYPNDNLSWVGWTTATDATGVGTGHIGFDMILASDQSYGSIRQKNYNIGIAAGPQTAPGGSFKNAMTYCLSGECTLVAASSSTPTTTTDLTTPGTPSATAPAATPDVGFFGTKFLGIPMWGVLTGGAVLLTGLGVFGLRHKPGVKPAAPTANHRRRR